MMPPGAPGRTISFSSATKPSITTHCLSCLRKEFSSTAPINTRLRRRMFAWLDGPGENLRLPIPNSTNYLTNYEKSGAPAKRDESAPRPFPLNPTFISQSILSEPLKHEIYKRIQTDGKSVRQVSVELGVEMRRVGAVVRLMELEKKAIAEGEPTAIPYARAIHSMVPTTRYDASSKTVTPHEPINDLPVHPLTNPQIFYPTSESRAFNRVDAGRVFSGAPRLPDPTDKSTKDSWEDNRLEIVGQKGHEIAVLKPADARIPHPQLIAFEKDKRNPKFRGQEDEIKQRYAQRLYDDAKNREALRSRKFAEEEAQKTRLNSRRWEFIVTDAQTTREGTGLDGRGHKSPGVRYGVPSQDRKRGQIKIPTRVEV